ncbi:MAG: hypothetical protein IH624_03175 [Phycisphaerae bacterium]|nr:hypothetical protein [Phycisphaerae bacterium]
MKKVLIMLMCLTLAGAVSAGRGQVLYEVWDNIGSATNVAALTSHADYPNNPTFRLVLPSIDGPVNRLDSAYAAINNFGSRIRGYIVPPQTANYTFKICTDDNGELWLSTDADPNNLRRIARVTAYTARNDFADPDIVVDESAIPLQAGQKYYFEALHKEGAGGDNISVGWISDGTVIGTVYTPIQREYLWIPGTLEALAKDNRGVVLYETYDDITGGNVSDLTNNARYPNQPTTSWMLFNGVDGPASRADNYGSRITGCIIPPQTANYRFKVCVDDRAELWLSTDANPANLVLISTCTAHAGSRNNFLAETCIESDTIRLFAGKKYYFMSLHKEGTGGDYHSVGWVSDGTAIGSAWQAGTANVIGRDYITAFGYWASTEVSPDDGALGVNPSQPLTLQWLPGFMPNPIVEYRIFFSNDPAIGVPDPNGIPHAVVAAGDPKEVVIAANTLGEGVDYYWRVDAYTKPATDLTDPNNMAGELWTFKTIRTAPIVDAAPVNVNAWRDEVVTFSVQARSGENNNQGPLTYDWHDAAGSLGAPSLPVLEVTVGNENRSFYCVVSNMNGSQTSAAAKLHVKKWVAHWTFDEGEGYVAYDSSPAEWRTTPVPHHATLIAPSPAGIWRADGKIGGCIDLDGVDKYFDTFARASQFGLGGNKPVTFSAWVYPRAYNDGGIYEMGNRAALQNFSLRTRAGINEVERWRIQYYSGDRDIWTWRQDSNKNANPNYHFPSINAWVHFVHSYDGQKTQVYANGVLIVDWQHNPLNVADNLTLRIGQYSAAEFDGLIDDVQVFNYPLSREEVIDIYRQGVPDAKFCDGANPMDINGDCKIDLSDLEAVLSLWLNSGLVD